MKLIQSELLSSVRGVRHGFSDKYLEGDAGKLASELKFNEISFLKQVHSDIIHTVENRGPVELEGDAQVTGIRGHAVGVVTADCVPILLCSQDAGVVAAVHAGWRGTLQEIPLKTVRAIKYKYGIEPESLVAAIGPSIGRCCYEIGSEVGTLFAQKFEEADEYLFKSGSDKYHLDLQRVNELMLIEAGVPEVDVLNMCTKCMDDFYSYRGEGKGTGRQLSAIGIAG